MSLKNRNNKSAAENLCLLVNPWRLCVWWWLFVQLRKCHRYWWWSKGNHFSSGTREKDKKIEAVHFANVFYIFGKTIDEFLWENRKVKVSKPKDQCKELRGFRLHFFPNILKASWNDFLTHTFRGRGKKKEKSAHLYSQNKDDKWHILLGICELMVLPSGIKTHVWTILSGRHSNTRPMIKTGCGSEGRAAVSFLKTAQASTRLCVDIRSNQDNALELPRLLCHAERGPWAGTKGHRKRKGMAA